MAVVLHHSGHFFQQFFLDFFAEILFGAFIAMIETHAMIQQVYMQQQISYGLCMIQVK